MINREPHNLRPQAMQGQTNFSGINSSQALKRQKVSGKGVGYVEKSY
jgi:hypothetical protein